MIMEYIITPQSSAFRLRDLWKYRELFYFLVWRDIKVKYKQTIIGILWAILQPFLTMVVFTFLFGTIAQISTYDIPYPIFVYTGLLFWNLFSRSITTASESLIANQNLFKKVYFPKLVLPIASVIVNVIDFFFASVVLIMLMVYFRYMPNMYGLLLIPIGVGNILMLSIGIGSILSLLNIQYRDVRFITSYALQILLFVTPVVYPDSALIKKYHFLIFFNPLAGVIGPVRSLVLNIPSFDVFLFCFACFLNGLIFFIGITYFKKKESLITDII